MERKEKKRRNILYISKVASNKVQQIYKTTQAPSLK